MSDSLCNLCGASDSELVFVKANYRLVRCRQCNLLYVGNPPKADELARLYSFEHGYQTELVDDPRSVEFHEREAQLNLAALQGLGRPKGSLLDVGCSTGLFLAAARVAGWQVQGAEYSPDSSDVARRVHGLDVKTGALAPSMFAPGSFDVVTFWDVIEHVPDPVGTLKIAADMLKPGGLVVLKTPNVGGLHPQASLQVAHRLGFWGHPEPPGHLFQFSVDTLSRLSRVVGLEVVRVKHQRIPISYSFGTPRQWFRSAKWALYCLAFMPLAWIGPWLGRGDDIVLVARRV